MQALKRLTRRISGRALDPDRYARVFREYDEDRGYGDYHRACRDAMSRPIPAATFPLLEEGVEPVRVMSPDVATGFVETIRSRFAPGTFRKNAGLVDEYPIEDDDLERELLSASLSEEIDSRIVRFFRSEYFVHWYVVTRTSAGPSRNSFLWHCDRGPTAHLKLLVYLNGTREHGGNTEFVDRTTTRRMAPSGYLFGKVADRREDVAKLARRIRVPFEPRRFEIEAGGGILFEPASVLHRGIPPERSERFVLSICLLPSPVPWREALSRRVISRIARDEKWHEDASEILGAMGAA